MQELQAKEDAQTSRLTENNSLANKIIKDGYEVTIEAEYIVDGRKKRRVKKKKIKKVDSELKQNIEVKVESKPEVRKPMVIPKSCINLNS